MEYKQDKLWFTTHSTYESNEHGDWIKQHQTNWVANYPDFGFTPFEEYYREIIYYADDGR